MKLGVKFVLAIIVLSALALAWPFSNGPKDIRVTSVTDVDKDEPQFYLVSPDPRPSFIVSRIEFTTNTDLLVLAKKHEYNVSFAVGYCSMDGVKDNGMSLGSVYWGRLRIYFGTKDDAGYAAAVAKGPPFTYQAYMKKTLSNDAPVALCFTLAGGNMLGGKLRSNVATIPMSTAGH